MFFFFFSSRRRHTRYWRDWSSDVCSSDLGRPRSAPEGVETLPARVRSEVIDRLPGPRAKVEFGECSVGGHGEPARLGEVGGGLLRTLEWAAVHRSQSDRNEPLGHAGGLDRKSTRLNSSHANISY